MAKVISLSATVADFTAAFDAEMASVEIATSSIYGDHGHQFASEVKNFLGEVTIQTKLTELSNFAETGEWTRVLSAVI